MKNLDNYSVIKNKVRNLVLKKRFFARLNHNPKSFNFQRGRVEIAEPPINDDQLNKRLTKFYSLCVSNFEGNKESQWSGIFMQLQGDIHSTFLNGDEKSIAHILRNPEMYNLFYGFENHCRDLIRNKRLEDLLEPEMVMDSLISLCEAVGLTKISNPESLRIRKAISVEQAITLLENKFGFPLLFPNPFSGEYGVKTKNGIASYRAVQAIFQAWKISQIVKEIPNPSVLEIGGGLGRTAYYCREFGIKDYTIVDIPLSSISQGDFLGRTLSPEDIYLIGESENDEKDKISLYHTKHFFDSDKKYDLIVNVDSLTELDISIAKDYLKKINEISTLFLSINHENNSFSVNSLWRENPIMKKKYRQQYWLRRGYAEELFEKI